ncbi:MAG: hypothetical protein C0616_06860 [Desulfuromonas sp.]|nr:MAG: hypothetical protein C0616_06860 [Desulfuromonas sp.]
MKLLKTLFCGMLLVAMVTMLGCQEGNDTATGTGQSGLGRITGQVVNPLEGAYLYVYKQGMDLYGPAYVVSEATGADGQFDLQLPDGEYVLVVRKRQNGEAAGPVVAGDHKSEFIKLSVRGDQSALTLVAPVKIGDSRRLTKDAEKTKTGISGRILNADGEPVMDARVHIYDHVQMSERPKFVSEKTGPDGRYLILLPEGGTYYLAARDKFGGPPKLGDLYGRYDQGTIEPSAVVVRDGEVLQQIDITVTKVW